MSSAIDVVQALRVTQIPLSILVVCFKEFRSGHLLALRCTIRIELEYVVWLLRTVYYLLRIILYLLTNLLQISTAQCWLDQIVSLAIVAQVD